MRKCLILPPHPTEYFRPGRERGISESNAAIVWVRQLSNLLIRYALEWCPFRHDEAPCCIDAVL
jgi:hypothetical protein